MSKELTEEQIKEVEGHFDFFDEDDNGMIDIHEFTRLLKTISPESRQREAEKGFAFIDSNNNQEIDLQEFLTWWKLNWWQF